MGGARPHAARAAGLVRDAEDPAIARAGDRDALDGHLALPLVQPDDGLLAVDEGGDGPADPPALPDDHGAGLAVAGGALDGQGHPALRGRLGDRGGGGQRERGERGHDDTAPAQAELRSLAITAYEALSTSATLPRTTTIHSHQRSSFVALNATALLRECSAMPGRSEFVFW